MHNKMKLWILVAASLVLAGCILLGGAMSMLEWDLTKLSTVRYETNHHAVNAHYKNISITTDTADIVFVPSANGETSVVCYEQEHATHTVAVKDGTLIIELVDTRKWYAHIGINFSTPKITVSVPQGEFGELWVKANTGDVKIPKEFAFESIAVSEHTGNVTNYASASDTIKISTSTGDIRVENISAGTLALSVTTGRLVVSNVTCQGAVQLSASTGRMNLTGIACKSLVSDGTTGGISLKNVIAKETLSIERSTGHVSLDGCDAREIFLKTDTGDVTATLLSGKIVIAETDTGHVDVPKTITGGRCEITTVTGDIHVQIQAGPTGK